MFHDKTINLSHRYGKVQFEWIILIIAGLLEPCWVFTLEKSDNLRKIRWALATAVILIVVAVVVVAGVVAVLVIARKKKPADTGAAPTAEDILDS